MESWVQAKDGEFNGPFRRYVWNPIKEAADAYRTDKANYLKRYRALLNAVAPTLTQGKIDAPEIGYVFGYERGGLGKAELLHSYPAHGQRQQQEETIDRS
jgi:hypothetical protein